MFGPHEGNKTNQGYSCYLTLGQTTLQLHTTKTTQPMQKDFFTMRHQKQMKVMALLVLVFHQAPHHWTHVLAPHLHSNSLILMHRKKIIKILFPSLPRHGGGLSLKGQGVRVQRQPAEPHFHIHTLSEGTGTLYDHSSYWHYMMFYRSWLVWSQFPSGAILTMNDLKIFAPFLWSLTAS